MIGCLRGAGSGDNATKFAYSVEKSHWSTIRGSAPTPQLWLRWAANEEASACIVALASCGRRLRARRAACAGSSSPCWRTTSPPWSCSGEAGSPSVRRPCRASAPARPARQGRLGLEAVRRHLTSPRCFQTLRLRRRSICIDR